MIQLLAKKYTKHIAGLFALIIYLGMAAPVYGRSVYKNIPVNENVSYYRNFKSPVRISSPYNFFTTEKANSTKDIFTASQTAIEVKPSIKSIKKNTTDYIGGPTQPEMASFRSAGTSDMVNLFTGDFSYNIPLLDVGGYPVNIFYSGGASMEQEASWVGLGWNINPGSVSRNMRGVPDDFNGTEELIQEQNMKSNVTWGVNIGAGGELLGIKGLSIGAELGYSLNNYLGPAIEIGVRGGYNFGIGGKSSSEKAPIGVSIGLDAKMNSRSGMTLTPNLSLSAQSYNKGATLSSGIGISTSYNSRSGIKALQLSEQMSLNYTMEKTRTETYKNITKTTVLSEYSSSMGGSILSSSITFTKPSYMPSMRSVITNKSGAGRFQIGLGMFGAHPYIEAEGYGQVSSIEAADRKMSKPMVGYLYAENAKNDRNAVMDFTRFNDQEVTPNTTIISVPQYSYDVFSIQGEGTGGTIRAYRNDNGYVRDNYTASRDKSWSAGGDIGIPGHVGANFSTIKTPSTIDEWRSGNKLRATTGFSKADKTWENVYFRNPGENCVLNTDQYNNIGGTDLVRYKLGGSALFPSIEPKLQKISSSTGAVTGEISLQPANLNTERAKRTQVTSFLTAEEATVIGLDRKIKNYNPTNFLTAENKLNFTEIDRYTETGERRKNHISQINVTEADGKRYVYGIPVYNTLQSDLTFTVSDNCKACDLVNVEANEASLSSRHLNSGVGGKDGYVQITNTPAYAHSFLLSGLLSPDYVDVNGDGITEDDLGTAVKFNYTESGIHKWRTPLVNSNQANSNPGNLTEERDDKGIISYGERESWYLQSMESKTMIAFFTLEDRDDGKGAMNESGMIEYGDHSLKKLKQIDLYNKADLKKNGLTGARPARPIKTVHFEYNYSLCSGTPDNPSGGKLTLEKIWFTYNGQTKSNKTQYVFAYTKNASAVAGENPSYKLNESDRWGSYKSSDDNPQSLMNRDYPYSLQDKTKADQNANAWALKKILLPSGGQLEAEYESDDYAFVQNKRAAVMSTIIGLGDNISTIPKSNLYTINSNGIVENDYIFIKVTEACTTQKEVYEKYLRGMDQLLVKMQVIMPKGPEILTSYASIADYGVYTGAGTPAIWVRMQKVQDGNASYSPLSMTALEFIRERLPAQAFKAYDVSEGTSLTQLKNMFEGIIEGIKTAFSRIPTYLREEGKAQTITVNRSFVRLNKPNGFKYGGGYRVKKIVLKDNWDRMTGQYGSQYGQEYDYTTQEVFNGTPRTISSGVASYEPSIGGEENPFQSIVQISNKVPFGPSSYGAIEMPVMDAFFPSPLVGYSKVTVTSIGKKQNTDAAKKTRSGVGRQVTEFYTAKDYPVYYSNTPLDPGSDVQEHISPAVAFLCKYAFDSRAISQGFLVATNDMHGKMKSQASYAENDPSQRVNYTENFYRNTGIKGLDEKFDFVYNEQAGKVIPGNMGIDIELMTDTREFSVKSHSLEIQAQVDWLIPWPVVWLPFVWPVVGESENTYRAVTTTKVINYHSVLDRVVVIDKGSQVSTENLIYDAQTGQVVVNRTNNEFDKPVYSVSYPAYWAYSGMGPAYKNINAVYSGVNFLDGKITSNNVPANILESGDELYIVDAGSAAGCDPLMGSPPGNILIWALDKNKPETALTNTNPDFIFLDAAGNPYNRSSVKFRIVRSGKRNMLSAPVAAATLMTNPVDATTHTITYNPASKAVNASAVEYKEKWQTDNDVFRKLKSVTTNCETTEVDDCNGYVEKKINPYIKGLLGNFRGYRNLVYYGERAETNPTSQTNLPENGFLVGFTPYWNFDASGNLLPANSNPKWVWKNQSTRFNSKGMELETKDALNIYTAAQYGYSKTLPVAIVNNSRSSEMFYEGFEDYGYNDLLNNSLYNVCGKKSMDFSGANIIEADGSALKAHTGKYVLAVNGNSTFSKNFTISNNSIDAFNLNFSTGTSNSLNVVGGNISNVTAVPGFAGSPNPVTYVTNATLFTDREPSYTGGFISNLSLANNSVINGNKKQFTHNFSFKTSHYINVAESNNYYFDLNFNGNGYQLGPEDQTSFRLSISDVNEGTTRTTNLSGNYIQSRYSVYLCKGIYLVEANISNAFNYETTNLSQPIVSTAYTVSVKTDAGAIDYKSLSSTQSCSFTVPIPGNTDMFNPVFSIADSKKMIFSGWVYQGANTGSKVSLRFANGTSKDIVPKGPVIEGWQRAEDEFVVPQGITSTDIQFVNGSGTPIYFDDIRIHPFNANMKSYVYDPVNLRLKSELDANNYASFYEYDEEGTLIRTKVETKEGVKTVSESRSAKQKNITAFQ